MLSKKVLQKLKELHAKRILIQVPEGLKGNAVEISEMLEKSGFEAIISVEQCFGSCDLRDKEAKKLGCDAMLHIGHSDLGLPAVVPVIYEEYPLDFDPVTTLKRNTKKLRDFNVIGLVSTVQYLGSLEKARLFLEKGGKKAITGKSEKLLEGQILGCDYSAAKSISSKVDCFLFIGSGRFHPLGLVGKTDKPVFFLGVENKTLENLSKEKGKLEVKLQLRIEKARSKSNFGIFVSTKPGQIDMKKAVEIKEILQRKGKKACIITADMLTPDKIMGMGIEVMVNTACPRIYDDQPLFGIVILNPEDADSL